MRILLIGDSCTDVYVYGEVTRLNPEAPVPVLEPHRESSTNGMAWNVYNNLLAFDTEVYLLTNQEKITKTRYIDEKSNQHILRVDDESPLEPMDYELPEDEYDALVISDYDKGFLTQKKIFELTQWFDGPVFIDSKKTTLPGDAYIKINEEEFKKITHYNPETLIVTKGGKGAEYNGKLYEGEKVKVYDVVGAGDTFLSSLVYFYLLYGTIEKAIPYANKASAIAVQNFGTYVLTENDVKDLCD